MNRRRQLVLQMLSRGDSMEQIEATDAYRILMHEDIPWLLALTGD